MAGGIPDRIGSYELGPELGRGGMGVVHRARDSRLGRDVAIKMLPEELARDPQRLERFEREARLLASLHHANIASIFGLEEQDGRAYLVLELVEGPTLEERLRQGPLPADEAIAIAVQIARGLEAAHAAGVVHRDLKPGNVKLTGDEVVKVLDFGLAKALEPAEATTSESPTMMPTHSPTIPGAILGTIGYMSPEQARGKPVDQRADIWAFGCILFEMLTGTRPFGGETVPDAMAATLRGDIDLDALPAGTPRRVRSVLRRCLERDRAERWHDIADVRMLLTEDDGGAARAAQPAVPTRSPLPWAIAAIVVAAAGVAVVLTSGRFAPAEPSRDLVSFDVQPPAGTTIFAEGGPGSMTLSISPDGTHIALPVVRESDSTVHVALRDLRDADARIVAGTRHSEAAYFSPDGVAMSFETVDGIYRVSLRGGTPQRITPLEPGLDYSHFWIDPHSLLLAIDGMVVSRVPVFDADGATPREVVNFSRIDSAPGMAWGIEAGGSPVPGRNDVVLVGGWYSTQREDYAIYALHLADGRLDRVVDRATQPRVLGRDTLVFQYGDALLAVPFDCDTLQVRGRAVQVLDGVRAARWTGNGDWDLSSTGTLVYAPGRRRDSELEPVVVAPDGTITAIAGEPAPFCQEIRLDPEGRRAAVTVLRNTMELWVVELATSRWTRLGADAEHYSPRWSPDGRTVAALVRGHAAEPRITLFPATGGPPHVVPRVERTTGGHGLGANDISPECWLDDERLLATLVARNGNIAVATDLESGEMEVLLEAEGRSRDFTRSTDGALVAYTSNRDGATGVYVAPLGDLDAPVRVSTEWSATPRWRADTRELYFLDAAGLPHRVTVNDTDGSPVVSRPEPALAPAMAEGNAWKDEYDVRPDGSILAVRMPAWQVASPCRVVLGFGDLVREMLYGE